ncbi:hypothetical protein, partial [Streptomyces alkaliterrae]|uniref:hypothetical protein n=1 Tax=Streptomyces alkaliterrae TaxID=2213162 RepID=UPI001E3B1C2C
MISGLLDQGEVSSSSSSRSHQRALRRARPRHVALRVPAGEQRVQRRLDDDLLDVVRRQRAQ